MKQLAKKLYKLQLKGELNGSLISHSTLLFTSPDDYVRFIRKEMVAHARRMHWYNQSIRMTENGSFLRALYANSRKRLHRWLDNLEAGLVDYL